MRNLSLCLCLAMALVVGGISSAAASVARTAATEAGICNPMASETSCVSQRCESLGTTMLDVGENNIIACLLSDDNVTLKWKTVTSVKDSLSCGSTEVMVAINNGVPVCRNITCPNREVLVGISATGPICKRVTRGTCTWRNVDIAMGKTVTCNSNEYVEGVEFGPEAWTTSKEDNLKDPEVLRVNCCTVTRQE